MSWQSYVDDHLIGTGKVHKAAILGQAGGVWATSAGYDLTPQQQKVVNDAFKNPDATQDNGIHLADQKFITLFASGSSIYGKKGADGCVLVKTTQAILVAEYNPPVQQPEAVAVVEKLGDYLRGAGY